MCDNAAMKANFRVDTFITGSINSGGTAFGEKCTCADLDLDHVNQWVSGLPGLIQKEAENLEHYRPVQLERLKNFFLSRRLTPVFKLFQISIGFTNQIRLSWHGACMILALSP